MRYSIMTTDLRFLTLSEAVQAAKALAEATQTVFFVDGAPRLLAAVYIPFAGVFVV